MERHEKNVRQVRASVADVWNRGVVSSDSTAWAWSHSPYKVNEPRLFIVHLAIAEVVNNAHGWEFYMAAQNLADQAGTSRQFACQALKRMVSEDLLEVVEPSTVEGKPTGRPARYRFLMGVHSESAPPVHADSAPGCTATVHPVHSESARNQREPNCEPNSSPASKRSRRKPQVPLPSPFELEDEHVAWAERECSHVDWEAETENFVTWWRAKDGRFADWHQAWRNWLRKAERRLVAS